MAKGEVQKGSAIKWGAHTPPAFGTIAISRRLLLPLIAVHLFALCELLYLEDISHLILSCAPHRQIQNGKFRRPDCVT